MTNANQRYKEFIDTDSSLPPYRCMILHEPCIYTDLMAEYARTKMCTECEIPGLHPSEVD